MAPAFLHGLETEYAFSQFAESGGVLDRAHGLRTLFAVARKRLECLPDAASSGFFLGNGSRFYIDAGHHPELSTPECSDPWQLVRYLKAGEAILIDLARDLDEQGLTPGLERTCFFRNNVDYHSHATWGCHESYQYRERAKAMPAELIPHLVSRIVFTGAGGFDDRAPGVEFVLSPRVGHLERVSSNDSTGNRGIFHTKDEPLSRGGWHRLHLICGESLCGELGSFLKVATTALIVRLIEHDASGGRAVILVSPRATMKAFSADPTCRRTASLTEGGRMSAIEIQRHYLAAAEASTGRAYMPDWAEDVCRIWRATLDRLDPLLRSESCDDVPYVFDWAIKQQLYAGHAERRGFAQPDVQRYNRLARKVAQQLDAQRPESLHELQKATKRHSLARKVAPTLERHEVRLEEFQAFLALRAELCEIDTRFGELGERGLHTILERSGTITHSLAEVSKAWLQEGIPGILHVDRAKSEPPPEARSHFRGNEIRRLAASEERCSADWHVIIDHKRNRIYDLSDPFGTGAGWRDPTEDSPLSTRLRLERARARGSRTPF